MSTPAERMSMDEPVELTTPPATDGRWPAWLLDTAVAAAGAAALSAALSAAVGAPLALAAAFWAWAGRADRRPDEPLPGVRTWLETTFRASERIQDEIDPVVYDIVVEGALLGSRSAEAVLEHVADHGELPGPAVTLTVDWDGWEPGNPEAARQVLSADGHDLRLLDLLNAAGIELRGVAGHRVDDIAAVLSEALERGASVDATAEALRGVLDDPAWAEMTAWTELNRATSAAAQAEYLAEGMTSNEWMNARDQRVCPRCKANEDAGPVPIGEPFPSGDAHPPAHPRCRCGLLPVLDGVELGDWDKAARGDSNNLEHYWKRGEGRAKWIGKPHPWTALYHQLRRHLGDDRAKRTASQWFFDTHGYWPGSRKGDNPVGKG